MTEPIPTHAMIVLTRPVEHQQRIWPEGSVGTVIYQWRNGIHYTIEFIEPVHDIVIVNRSDIQLREGE